MTTTKENIKNFKLRRGYTHHHVRGSEQKVRCVFCGRVVSKYKAVPTLKRFSTNISLKTKITDFFAIKSYACPSCAKIHHLKKQNKKEKSKTSAFHKKAFSKRF